MISYTKMFFLRCKGYNMREIADLMGVTTVTIQRHFTKLKSLTDEEFKRVFKDTLMI